MYLEKTDPAKNQNRYYSLCVAKTLFGDYALMRQWGRIGNRGGRRLSVWYDTEKEAQQALETLQKRKQKRGYVIPLRKV